MSNPSTQPDRVLVCMPTYNEAESLPGVLTALRHHNPDVDVLVIDDASPDGTGELADGFAERDDHIHVLHRKGKGGLGGAYLAGFDWALNAGYDVIVEMDADGSHRPEDLPALLAASRDADLVLGTRWMPGGRTVNWPRRRQLLSLGGNRYARFMLGVPLRDITGGFRAYRSATLRALNLSSVRSEGYCFQVELALRAVEAGKRTVEVPITFVERRQGASKMSQAIVIEAMRRVTEWGLQRRLRKLRRPAPAAAGHRDAGA